MLSDIEMPDVTAGEGCRGHRAILR